MRCYWYSWLLRGRIVNERNGSVEQVDVVCHFPHVYLAECRLDLAAANARAAAVVLPFGWLFRCYFHVAQSIKRYLA
jgi:hypothetical protein